MNLRILPDDELGAFCKDNNLFKIARTVVNDNHIEKKLLKQMN